MPSPDLRLFEEWGLAQTLLEARICVQAELDRARERLDLPFETATHERTQKERVEFLETLRHNLCRHSNSMHLPCERP